MKKFSILSFLTILSLVVFASEITPCCMCGKHHEFTLPISDPNTVNNVHGSKKFSENGDIMPGINLNEGPQLIFSGTQRIFAAINIDKHMYAHGHIWASHVNAGKETTIFVNQNSRLTIEKYIPNGNTRLMGWDETSVFVIRGKEYKVNDTIQINNLTIKIEKCNQSLPVVFGDIYAEYYNGSLVVGWKVSSELNNDHFIIELSKDGKKFEPVKKVASLGDVQKERLYAEALDIKAAYILGFGFFLLSLGSKKWMRFFLIPGFLIFIVACQKEYGTDAPKAKFVRIVQVDKDGKKSESKVVTIKGY